MKSVALALAVTATVPDDADIEALIVAIPSLSAIHIIDSNTNETIADAINEFETLDAQPAMARPNNRNLVVENVTASTKRHGSHALGRPRP